MLSTLIGIFVTFLYLKDNDTKSDETEAGCKWKNVQQLSDWCLRLRIQIHSENNVYPLSDQILYVYKKY